MGKEGEREEEDESQEEKEEEKKEVFYSWVESIGME